MATAAVVAHATAEINLVDVLELLETDDMPSDEYLTQLSDAEEKLRESIDLLSSMSDESGSPSQKARSELLEKVI